jgi:hypothetical protein
VEVRRCLDALFTQEQLVQLELDIVDCTHQELPPALGQLTGLQLLTLHWMLSKPPAAKVLSKWQEALPKMADVKGISVHHSIVLGSNGSTLLTSMAEVRFLSVRCNYINGMADAKTVEEVIQTLSSSRPKHLQLLMLQGVPEAQALSVQAAAQGALPGVEVMVQ